MVVIAENECDERFTLLGEAESLGGKEGLRLTENGIERLLIHEPAR
jgi:hypothetical protein